MRQLTLAAAATTALLTSSCGLKLGGESASANLTQPIWQKSEAPFALDIIQMTPGEEAAVSLTGASAAGPFTARGAQALGGAAAGNAVTIETNGSNVAIEARGPFRDFIKLTDSDSALWLPVIVEPMPMESFVYDPEGEDVETVALAGSFNGWSATDDLFTEGDDGIWRIEKAIPPGDHTYKLVVDGEWMPDPANPERDTSGFDNSLLTVEGESREVFELQYLNSKMPGANQYGGFHAKLPAGDSLESATITINNQLLPTSAYTISGNTIRLNQPYPLYAENWVTIFAESREGAQAEAQFPITFSYAPRSPRDEVIYYTFTDRFNDGDPSLNNPADDSRLHPLTNYLGGDFAGITEKIREGYFDRLGVTTLWISPPNLNTPKVEQESVEPGRWYTSYHGYWPTSDTETNVQFGTMQDLRTLVQTAHEHDIAVLLDYVANHVHEDHPLAQRHPDLASPLLLPNGEQNIRKFDSHPFTTWFDTFLPTIDYVNNPELIDIMTDNAIWWLKATGADGFRHDAVKHIPEDFWTTLTTKLREEFPDRMVYQVGETISGHSTVARFVGPDLLEGQFDFPTYFAIQTVLARGNGSMGDLAGAIRDAERYYPPSAIMSPLLGNHDVARFMGYADGDLPPGVNEKEVGFTNPPVVDQSESYDKLRLGFAYLAAIPGPATIYYGDEIGMTGAHDPDNRRMMLWEWNEQQTMTFDAAAALNRARHGSIALRRGSVEVLHSDDERLILARHAPEETVLISLARNPDPTTLTMAIPPHWGEISAIEPLAASGNMRATLSGNRVRINDGDYGYGLWRVNW